MSSASSARSGLRGRTVVVPLIPCPCCQATVRYYVSNTEDHEGWVFCRCPNHSATGCDFWFWEMEYVAYLVDA
uniref:Zinc finger GRF-type domain-containing protein n=1 Tax=Triticum urartu TaxID=4572 RepID=A0A8R7V932_TRIUA